MIKTPVSAGQKQFGSARCLTDKEKDKHFKSVLLDSTKEKMKEFRKMANE